VSALHISASISIERRNLYVWCASSLQYANMSERPSNCKRAGAGAGAGAGTHARGRSRAHTQTHAHRAHTHMHTPHTHMHTPHTHTYTHTHTHIHARARAQALNPKQRDARTQDRRGKLIEGSSTVRKPDEHRPSLVRDRLPASSRSLHLIGRFAHSTLTFRVASQRRAPYGSEKTRLLFDIFA
jgi:hypothetical protein